MTISKPVNDLQQFGLKGSSFVVDLIHGSPVLIPIGLSPLVVPYAVFIADGNLGAKYIVGTAWTLDGNNQPLVTVTLDGAATRTCVVVVCYKE